jgi:hypothetical protein
VLETGYQLDQDGEIVVEAVKGGRAAMFAVVTPWQDLVKRGGWICQPDEPSVDKEENRSR